MNTSIRKTNMVILSVLCAIMLAVGCLFITNTNKTYAADADTVKVTGLKVEWDGNGGNHDLINLRMDNAAYVTDNSTCNNHRDDWVRPFIYVNGEQIPSGSIAWGRAKNYGVATDFCFFLNQDILKQDGNDIIEVKKGCKVPMEGDEDYYLVSEDAKFFATGKPGVSGQKEQFHNYFDWQDNVEMDVTDSVLKGQSAETLDGKNSQALTVKYRNMWGLKDWAGNTGKMRENQFIRIEFTKPIDSKVLKSLDVNYLYNDKNAVFDYYKLDATALNNSTLIATDYLRGSGAGQHVVLNTADFADESGNMHGFIVALSENALVKAKEDADSGSQYFIDSVKPMAAEATKFVYEADKKYDATEDIFVKLPVKTIEGVETPSTSIGDLEVHNWGITGFATFSGKAMNLNQSMKFKFINPIDVAQFKSIELEVMHNDNDAKFYVYPVNTTDLSVDNAVCSFRTPAGAGQIITLSTEALAENGLMRGFIIKLVEKNGDPQQFFIDSVTPKTAPKSTDVVATFTDGVEAVNVPFNTAVARPDAVPTKEATAEYTYEFDDWYVGDAKFDFNTKLTEDITITAKFTATKNSYNVTFLNEDGSAIGDPVSVVYGEKVVAPADPTKEATKEFTFAFDGWYNGDTKFDPANDVITGEITLKARFTSTKNSYTVTFLNEDGSAIGDPVSVVYGEKVIAPADPEKAATAEFTFTFDDWYLGEEKFNFESAITDNIELKARFTSTKNSYNVTFVNEEGHNLGDPVSVVYGEMVARPETDPKKSATNEFTYTFDDWYLGEEKFNFETAITGEITLTAKFTATKNSYNVTFLNEDGTAIGDPVSIVYGEKVIAPADPTKEATKEFTFAFDGWYNGDTKFDPANDVITGEITLKARFTSTKNSYNVTFVNEEGHNLGDPVSVVYGEMVARPETDPKKPATNEFTYTFDDWYLGEEKFNFETAITGEITLTAKFTATKNSYKVKFVDEDGTAIGNEITLEYGKAVTKPSDPTKEGYEFAGWYVGEDEYDFTKTITGDVTITAKFNEVKKGCGGSIESMSIYLSVLALAGVMFIVLRKRKQDR